MNVVILHCHFERGGVTQVVENHVKWLHACDSVARIFLVSGDRVGGLTQETRGVVQQIIVKDFDYDSGVENQAGDSRGTDIRTDLVSALSSQGINAENSVLHWHNHSLGKNTAAPAVIRGLAERGWRMLLQIHDFAEDNRPANLAGLVKAAQASNREELDRYLYPIAKQIRYATLTEADAAVLRKLGVPADATECLPNSVVAPPCQLDSEAALLKVREAMQLPKDSTWCLYPVRGIRRKNVGEFVLLCRWLRLQMYGGLTLRPSTPVEQRSYDRWRSLAADVAPRAVFDAANHPNVSFSDNLAAASFAMSTSVAEGFGMVFLEPWLAGREVIARQLPTVVQDFQAAGVDFPKLYQKISIPGDSAWLSDCRNELNTELQAAWSAVSMKFRPSVADADSINSSQTIDFALLTPSRQVEVLQRLQRDEGFESEVKAVNSELISDLTGPTSDALVANSKAIQNSFSLRATGDKLLKVYSELINESPNDETRSPSQAGLMVDFVAEVRPFYPCRTEQI